MVTHLLAAVIIENFGTLGGAITPPVVYGIAVFIKEDRPRPMHFREATEAARTVRATIVSKLCWLLRSITLLIQLLWVFQKYDLSEFVFPSNFGRTNPIDLSRK
jgi:hypothetical protein